MMVGMACELGSGESGTALPCLSVKKKKLALLPASYATLMEVLDSILVCQAVRYSAIQQFVLPLFFYLFLKKKSILHIALPFFTLNSEQRA